MNFDVFISHSHEDKPTADAACASLEAAGIRCWIAPRDILPGKEYAAAIVDAIDQCRVMVIVFSSTSNRSKQIVREVERAINRGVPIVPLRIEDIMPTESMAYFMESVHWLDALTPPLEQHLAVLVNTIKTLLQAGSAASINPARASINPTSISPASTNPVQPGWLNAGRSAAGSRKKWFIGSAIVVAAFVALMIGGAWIYHNGRTTPAACSSTRPYGPPATADTEQTRVNCFTFNSLPGDPNPGLRVWERHVDGTWTETYPNGFSAKGIQERARADVNGCRGSIVGPSDQPGFSVFIPDKGCPGMMVLFRSGSGHWNVLGPMKVAR